MYLDQTHAASCQLKICEVFSCLGFERFGLDIDCAMAYYTFISSFPCHSQSLMNECMLIEHEVSFVFSFLIKLTNATGKQFFYVPLVPQT